MALNSCSETAPLPQGLWQSAVVRQGERRAAELAGVAMYQLMERAGAAVWQRLRSRWPGPGRLLVCCGGGNNGGDGFVVARLALEAGWQVQLVRLGELHKVQGDAAIARQHYLTAGGQEIPAQAVDWPVDVIVDALLGTGLQGEVRQPCRQLIEAINLSKSPVVAVDIPSGLCSDTGRVLGCAINAVITVSFIALKSGLVTGQAAAHVGQLIFAGLGVEQQFAQLSKPFACRYEAEDRCTWLAPRKPTAHKGDFGHVVVCGGGPGMPGAVRMSAEAALRVGAGWVTVISHASHLVAIGCGRPELMIREYQPPATLELPARRRTVMVLGPGLGREAWSQALWQAALSVNQRIVAMVVDADGLNLLAQRPQTYAHWVLTPHAGEAARLLGCTPEEVEADRYQATRRLQQRYGGVVVLKGAGTLVCDEQQLNVINVGNPGMASAGMGDVLSGIIGGLLAQGVPAFEAARLGVWLHGRAADSAIGGGERGLLAMDLMQPLRRLVNPSDTD